MLLGFLLACQVVPPVGSPSSADGAFTFRAAGIVAKRDFASGTGSLVLTVEAAWKRGTRPLYIDGKAHSVRFMDAKGKDVPVEAESGSLDAVEGRSAFSFDVVLPALPRTDLKAGLVEGKLNAVVAADMLAFRFDDLHSISTALPGGEARKREEKGVVCRVDRLVLGRERWSVRMALDYPPGNRVLESYQAGAMVAFNQLRLVAGKRVLLPTGYSADATGARRVVVTYHFTEAGAAPKLDPKATVLEYAAPARIVDQPLKFSFRDLPLP
ncbi:MAG: hypothetical protein K2W96_13350 [Gemmataceae bacterium]|nr:hypothetical protein [Gemmataceae bacterium]